MDRSAIELVAVEALTVGLVLLALRRLDHLQDRLRKLEGGAAPLPAPAPFWKSWTAEPRRGWIARIFASAEEPHNSTRMWVRLIVPVIATVLLGQLLNLGGCNTTPTQTRLNNLEERAAAIEAFDKAMPDTYVPRKEHEAAQVQIGRLNDQREARLRRVEDQIAELYRAMLERVHP